MNDKKIVENMISFIENKERQLQAQKLSTDTAAKNDVIKAIFHSRHILFTHPTVIMTCHIRIS